LTTLYAESSAVLRWLLGAVDAPVLQEALVQAQIVVTSSLTSTEVARTLRRLVATGAIGAQEGDDSLARYAAASAHWHFYAVTDAVLARAAQPLPQEPVRTLDAIHLATAALFALEVTLPTVLSVDHQVRVNAQALGMHVMPPPP
jgi:predicted nucleic acid-binding protein